MSISELDESQPCVDCTSLLNNLWKQVASEDGMVDVLTVLDFLHSCHLRLRSNEERILNIERIIFQRQH